MSPAALLSTLERSPSIGDELTRLDQALTNAEHFHATACRLMAQKRPRRFLVMQEARKALTKARAEWEGFCAMLDRQAERDRAAAEVTP